MKLNLVGLFTFVCETTLDLNFFFWGGGVWMSPCENSASVEIRQERDCEWDRIKMYNVELYNLYS
jgi:hypothetical protein